MQIALFGGSFDPPHLGHFQIALHILEKKLADQVWFIPVKKHPFGKKMSADQLRVQMLQLMVDDGCTSLKEKEISTASIRVDTYEVEHQATSFSLHTLDHFHSQYPEHSFSWVIGSDNLASFHKWYKAEELLTKYAVLVYPRQGFPFHPLAAGMIPLTDMPEIHISSTEIRYKVEHGESIRDLVSPQEEQFLTTHNFYHSNEEKT